MSPKEPPEERTCPGEKYSITLAICRTRQRNRYPKCLLCPHRSAEVAGAVATDPKVRASIFHSTSVMGRVPQEVNEYVMRKVGLAAAQLLRAENPGGSRFLVACDGRDNSRSFGRVFCEGVNRGGMDAVSLGAAPPELLAFVLGTDGCTGAAFVGGGNWPANVNGVRLWRGDASPLGFGAGLEKVGLIARRLRTGRSRLPGNMVSANPLADYIPYLMKFGPKIGPLKVVMDAGNGAAGRLFEALFDKLPAEMVPLHFEEDGHSSLLGKRFPAEEVVSAMQRKVRETGAHLGAAVDFNGERVAFFTERGELLRFDVAAGLVAAELLARSPEAVIAYDLRSTAALRGRIKECGGQPVAAPAGPIAFAGALRRCDALYGADLTGLHYFKDFFRFPSPAIALILLGSHLSREGRPVSELAADLNAFSQSGEIVIEAPSADAAEDVLAAVREDYQDADRELIDGVTVRMANWWFNLRHPGKSAQLRLNVEGRTSRDQRRGRQEVERAVAKILSAMEK